MKRPLASKLALVFGIGVAITDFVLAFPKQPEKQAVDLWIVGILFSGWQGLPLALLAQMKVFWRYPVVNWVLLSLGGVVLMKVLHEVYDAPHGSTAGLALIFGPLYVLAGYAVLWAVFKFAAARGG